MKKFAIVSAIVTCAISTSAPVYANVDDVNAFLSQYASSDNAFYVEEFSGEDSEGMKHKSLIVRTDLSELNIDPSNTEEIFTNMVSQNWFDYTGIYNINVSSVIGSIAPTYFYDIETGTKIDSSSEHPSSMRFPWIIKNEGNLTDDERRFLLRIAQEILQGSVDTSISLNIGSDNECTCSIKDCNGLAEIKGKYSLDSIDYVFSIQFTYETNDYQDGTYTELYLGINNVDLFGTNVKFEYRTYDK